MTESPNLAFRDERQTSERRCIREMDPNSRVAPQFEMREVQNGTGGTSLRFSGYASVVGKPYEMQDMAGTYNETIDPKAFKRTLDAGADVSFLCNHAGVTMARTKAGTLKLSSDATGLYTEATLNPSRGDVQIVRAAVQDGDLDEMSMAFRVLRQDWTEDYTKRLITEGSLHKGDVSVVNYAASEHTAGLVDIRGRQGLVDTGRPLPKAIVLPDYTREARQRLRLARIGPFRARRAS
ncbi:MAG: HK97 family phage prohead protease [Acidimicrobiales bacterium]